MGATAAKPEQDARLWEPWAMITDGQELYEVLSVKTIGGFPTATRWLEVENCSNGEFQQFTETVINERFTLVRAAPCGCPDSVTSG